MLPGAWSNVLICTVAWFLLSSLSKSDTQGISITRVKADWSFKKGAVIGFLYVQNQLLLHCSS